MQLVKGSPVNPVMQVQEGVCMTTEHWALFPHDPTQGSVHF